MSLLLLEELLMIETKRLILRQWREEDLDCFVKLNADPRVMEYFPAVKTLEESVKEYEAILEHFKKHGYGWWAVSERDKMNFIGFIGLRYIDFPASFTPAVEVAWRLAYDYWGKGYATEGARASLRYGFERLNLSDIIAVTSAHNLRSKAVMKRIGMQHDPRHDFDHPKLPKDHKLSRHVFYRIKLEEWQQLHELS